jgi:endoglucanase
MRSINLMASLLLGAALVSCGGGSSGSSPSPTPPSSSSSVSSSPASSSSSVVVSSDDSSSSSQASSISSVSSSASSAGPLTVSKFIVVDQFGYLPDAKKIAVIRDPQTGFDALESFSPGAIYKLINTDTNETAYSAAPSIWKSGATSPVAGDKVWWFDFSSVTTPGIYAVVDEQNNVRSPDIRIGTDVYKPVLKHALRTFFYQRAGFAKEAPYADAGWTDGASHLGVGQDTEARLFKRENGIITGVAGTEKDLSGGWFDAGDYNKYTNWHAEYLVLLLHAYLENPAAWTDDFNIPESGNGIPDLLDEIKWGFDWLIKMQEADGAVLSIMGLAHASPPSSATGPSFYGPASTSATLTSAGAFALGSNVFAALNNEALETYAADLYNRAQRAWHWADANPNVIFQNNEGASEGLGAGQQEVDDAGRLSKKVVAAIYLYAATGSTAYRDYVDSNIKPITWVGPWDEPTMASYLYYASLPTATPATSARIRSGYLSGMNEGGDNWPAIRGAADAYRAFLGPNNFTWGSNRTMARKGMTFYNLVSYGVGNVDPEEVRNAALGYIHYLHGVNPLGMAYLSNMTSTGAHQSVNEFYHSWFADGSNLWDRVGESTYGPAPGFLVGGPNPAYNWDACCPNSCGSPANNAVCTSVSLTPPRGQPPMKSYLDFNTSWPLNSWQITENHNDYQVAYLRLLSKFVQ